MKYLLILFMLCLSLNVKADIKNVPRQDLKKIKNLFEDLIDRHDFSYSIFGSKPMSLADFHLEAPKNLPFLKWIKSQFLMSKRRANLNAWYEYRTEFELKDFIFLDEEKDLIRCLALIIINKKNLLQVLNKNETIFKEVLGDFFTPESFMEKLEKREISIAQATRKSQKLLGIMLGYGVTNANIFQDRYDLIKEIAKNKDENLSQKLKAIETRIKCFSDLDEEAIVRPLYFLADASSDETIALKQQYESDRQKILRLRKKKNFMDLVLNRLVTPEE